MGMWVPVGKTNRATAGSVYTIKYGIAWSRCCLQLDTEVKAARKDFIGQDGRWALRKQQEGAGPYLSLNTIGQTPEFWLRDGIWVPP